MSEENIMDNNNKLVEQISDANSESEEDNRRGRFTSRENRILFKIILEDSRLRSAFCHQHRTRNEDGVSLIEDLTNRFNAISPSQRNKDTIRHHLKSRRGTSYRGEKQLQNSLETLLHYVNHHATCRSPSDCTRCMMMQRLRVQLQLARCDHSKCQLCDSNTPAVQEPFNALNLAFEIESQLKSLNGNDSGKTSNKRKLSDSILAGSPLGNVAIRPRFQNCQPETAVNIQLDHVYYAPQTNAFVHPEYEASIGQEHPYGFYAPVLPYSNSGLYFQPHPSMFPVQPDRYGQMQMPYLSSGEPSPNQTNYVSNPAANMNSITDLLQNGLYRA